MKCPNLLVPFAFAMIAALAIGCNRGGATGQGTARNGWSYFVVDVHASTEWKGTGGVYLLFQGKKLAFPAVFRCEGHIGIRRPDPIGGRFQFAINGLPASVMADDSKYLKKITGESVSGYVVGDLKDVSSLKNVQVWSFATLDDSFRKLPNEEASLEQTIQSANVITLPREVNGATANNEQPQSPAARDHLR
jgi:hypothetical protein